MRGDKDTGRTRTESQYILATVSELDDSPFKAQQINNAEADEVISQEDVSVRLKKMRQYINTEIKREASRSKSREPEDYDDEAVQVYDQTKSSKRFGARKLSLD